MHPLMTLFNALDPAFDGTTTWPTTGEDRFPRADIYEGEKNFRIVMDMPGVRNEDLEISIEGETLNIKADRCVEVPAQFKPRRRELVEKCTFRRSFTLGAAIETDKVEAQMKDGVLTIDLPKSQKSLPRRIEVK